MLAHSNVHPSVAQKLVGDSTIGVVMEVYTHLQDAEKSATMDAIEHRFGWFVGTLLARGPDKEKGQKPYKLLTWHVLVGLTGFEPAAP